MIEQISLLENVLPVDRREMVFGRASANSSLPAQIEVFNQMAEEAKIAEESLGFFAQSALLEWCG
ncbi:hypothetical protein HGP16_21205 [Rhizobium sp. P40RR-XXII]|uniref:hypothetical protein n=1 Tax=unclassified Rhizobium TaxID=2613769 RepID=UPI0014576D5F|nr:MULTISPECIES: hypothetical protein [unclassified Rhizobium]NLR88039.1 hypothetical protein [Rhizobium sp. P28RR-XV]NLS19061.1 hypothetical protein [Rhizobium sp. P40RR-XXII]